MAEKKENRRGLGRGLSALMADVGPQTGEDTAERGASRPADRSVPIDHIRPNPDQPRRRFSEDQLEELAASVRQHGIIQPIIVRATEEPDRYEIVAGERRWRAAQRAQLHEIPVLVRAFTDTEVLEVAIIENIQRADLNPIEEAAGYRQLMDKFGHTQEKLAEGLGKSRSHIANLLRLLSLPDEVQAHVNEGRLSAGQARALITSSDPVRLARDVVEKGLSVREVEKLAKGYQDKASKPKATNRSSGFEKDADTKALEADLSAALGMRVRIDHHDGGEAGQVTLSYETLDQLDALCALLSTYQNT